MKEHSRVYLILLALASGGTDPLLKLRDALSSQLSKVRCALCKYSIIGLLLGSRGSSRKLRKGTGWKAGKLWITASDDGKWGQPSHPAGGEAEHC